ncbi:alcohol dehydrogenase [Nocardia aurea]|uniref:alcohol dehydrogenase n=1 Tax=Nocardia aurea TaxID=2144174 RepID=UPI000D686338|nr:alcohol dehydrogenase [Nocardia aurea]
MNTYTYQRIDHADGLAFLTTAQTRYDSSESEGETVLLAPRVVGVCRSDLREIRGERFGRRDFGHEILGTVLDAPQALADLRGRTVLFDPHPVLRYRSSGFAHLVELVAEPTQLRAALVPAPPGLPTESAVLGEPLACVVHCVRRLLALTEDRGTPLSAPVAVVGAGIAGTLITATLLVLGYRCTLFNRRVDRIRFLLDRGALPPEVAETDPGRTSFEHVILATAHASPGYLDTSVRLLADGGLLMLFAGTQPGDRLHGLDIDQIRRHELTQAGAVPGKRLTLAGTYGATRADFTEALTLLSAPVPAGQWSLAGCAQRLIARRLELSEAPAYLTAAATSGYLGKAVVHITSGPSAQS